MDLSILPSVFHIGDKEYENSLAEDLYINPALITDACVTQPQLMSYYGTLHELALAHEASMKAQLERGYANLSIQVRTVMLSEGQRPTEKSVDHVVINNSEYVKLQDDYLQAKRQSGLIRAARDAVIHRKDMVVQVAQNERAEYRADISLKASSVQK